MKGGSQRRQRFQGSSNARNDRDDDLLLFRELFRREEKRNASLLQPDVSEEFEASHGNIQLYKMPSGKGGGYDFIAINSEKTDYDWLKTPPATPLFTSIELESSEEHNMSPCKELPNLKPLKTSRFAGKAQGPKPNNGSKSPGYRSASTSRSTTPTSSSSNSTAGGNLTLKEVLNLKQRSSSTHRRNPNRSSATAARISSSTSTAPKKQISPMPRATSAMRRRSVITAEAGRSDGGSEGNVVAGSRMLDKLTSARRSEGGSQRSDSKTKQRTAEADGAVFRRLISRDLASMEISKGSNGNQQNMGREKSGSIAKSNDPSVGAKNPREPVAGSCGRLTKKMDSSPAKDYLSGN